MSYLLDTNIVSDIAKRKDAGLLRWTEQPSPRRPKLEAWLQHDLPAQFSGRLLAVTQGVALAYGELAAQARRGGRPLPVTTRYGQDPSPYAGNAQRRSHRGPGRAGARSLHRGETEALAGSQGSASPQAH